MSDKKAYLNIPGEKSRELLARRQQFVARGVSSTMSVFAAKAEGAIIEDVDGNRYIDFAGGIGVMNIGHSRPEVVKAIAEQAAKFTHTCFSVMMYEPYVDLAERIVKIAPGAFPKKALFFNSGAEAVENAVKIARYATGKSHHCCLHQRTGHSAQEHPQPAAMGGGHETDRGRHARWRAAEGRAVRPLPFRFRPSGSRRRPAAREGRSATG